MGKWDKLALAVFAFVALLAYLPELRGSFIWDDPDYVVDNPTLRSLDGLQQIWLNPNSLPQYYPLVHTSFWIEYHLWGLNPLGYKLVNLALHLTSAFLLWRILIYLKIPGAMLAAGIFALHPVMVESVAWITERKNTLSLVFYLLAMQTYFRHRDEMKPNQTSTDSKPRMYIRGSEKLYWYALAFFVCALLSKTVACSLPAAMLLILWWKEGRIDRRDLLRLIPFFIIGAGLAFITAYLEKSHVGASGKDWDFTFADRVLIAGRALWFYAGKLLWPINQAFIYPRWKIDTHAWWQWLYPSAFTLLLIVLFAFRKQITRGPITAVLFFAGSLVPALGFVNIYPMRYSFVADHFQYTAAIGLIVLFSAAIARLFQSAIRNPQSAIPYPLLISLALLTWRQCRIYESKLTLWTDTTQKNPASWMAWLNLGHAYVEAGDRAPSTAAYRHALELAPGEPDPHFNVGYSRAVEGDYAGAIAEYQKAVALEPKYAQAWYSMGNAYSELHDTRRALDCYQTALNRDPTYAPAHNNIAKILQDQGDLAGAISHYESAIAVAPLYGRPYLNLANIYLFQGRVEQAMELYEKAISLNKDLEPDVQRILRSRGIAIPH